MNRRAFLSSALAAGVCSALGIKTVKRSPLPRIKVEFNQRTGEIRRFVALGKDGAWKEIGVVVTWDHA